MHSTWFPICARDPRPLYRASTYCTYPPLQNFHRCEAVSQHLGVNPVADPKTLCLTRKGIHRSRRLLMMLVSGWRQLRTAIYATETQDSIVPPSKSPLDTTSSFYWRRKTKRPPTPGYSRLLKFPTWLKRPIKALRPS